jgi:hypothetical protein
LIIENETSASGVAASIRPGWFQIGGTRIGSSIGLNATAPPHGVVLLRLSR